MKYRFSLAFYKSLFDNMVDGLAYCRMIFDAQGNPIDYEYIETNKNFEKLTGLKNVVGKKVSQTIPGISMSNPELLEMYGRVSLMGESERFEIYIEALSCWFLVSVYSPRKKYFVSVFQNITSRKDTEKSLEDSRIAAKNVLEDLGIEKSKMETAQAKEEAILLSIGDGLLATDELGNIILFNSTAEKLLDKKREDVMGKTFSEVIHLEDEKGLDIPSEKHPVFAALAGNAHLPLPPISATYYMRKDKARFPVAIMARPVILNQNVIGSIQVFRDISREKEIDRAKSEFVSLVSHQLRTPLTTISWYTEMILSGDAGDVVLSQRKYLEKIYIGNRRMIELVNTFLDVSRIELGTFRADPKPSDILMLADNVLEEQKFRIDQKNIAVSLKFSRDIPTLLADPKLVRMIFQNLLTNAIEYTPIGGKIGFSISSDDKKNVDIEVSDNGYGIPKNQQEQIFTKLFRADNVRNKDTDGTGLGLYIIKSIVENSGGKIWFESEENKGSAFHVMLPLDSTKK